MQHFVVNFVAVNLPLLYPLIFIDALDCYNHNPLYFKIQPVITSMGTYLSVVKGHDEGSAVELGLALNASGPFVSFLVLIYTLLPGIIHSINIL